jgi:hypothetical protein
MQIDRIILITLKLKIMTIQQLKTENEMLKQLIKYGKIYINSWSSDCDGGHSTRGNEFSSVDDVYKWEEDKAEWADGPFGWNVVEPNEFQSESHTWFTR